METLNLAGLEKTKRFGAFIPDVEDFDEHLFSISSHEAIFLDPQQRILLECSWLAVLERYALDHLHNFSVSVGVSYNEYFLTNVFNGVPSSYLATSGTLSSICGRISFQLGCKGPSVSLDTACSSSLVGLHLSLSSFMPQGWNKALCCGVNLMLRPQASWVLSLAGMLCDDARCKTLDSSADGYGRAESCIAHHLENSIAWLSSDEHEKNENLVYIAGTSVGQDGRSSSLTAPNGNAQQQVIRKAFLSNSTDPSDANCLELHGTGTKLGDPIELGAAADIFCADRKAPIRVQASKSHMLHSEPAAGAVGLSWMFKSLTLDPRASFLPRLREINPFVIRSLGEKNLCALSIQRQSAVPAAIQNCMITGSISSFAYQGTNSHAIATGFQPEPFDARHPMKWRRRHFWWQIPMVPILEHFLSYTRLDASILFEGSLRYNESYLRHFRVLDREIICPPFLASAYQRFLLGMIADEDRLALESNLFHYAPLKNVLGTKLLFECRIASSKVEISSNHNQMKTLLSSFVKVLKLRDKLSNFRKRSIILTGPGSQYTLKKLSTYFSMTDAQSSNPCHAGDLAIDAIFQSALVSPGCHGQRGFVATSARILHQYACSINIDGHCELIAGDIAQAGYRDGSTIIDATMARFSSEAIVSKSTKIGAPSSVKPPQTFHEKTKIQDEIKQIFLGFVEQSADQTYSSLGLDSISSLEVRELLQNRFSISLPATIVYDYPSLPQITDYIFGLLSSIRPVMKIHHAPSTHARGNIVGILAGTEFGPDMQHAKRQLTSNPSEFLKRIDFCRVTPISRWDTDDFHAAKFSASYEPSLKFGCWLESPELFDRSMMNMSEQESLGLDPQCRLLLECVFQLTHAKRPWLPGYTHKSTGVYVGCVWSEYNVLIEQYARDAHTFHLIGNGLHFISGRISYTLGLGGPCMGLNTACSSSLVALHLAKKALDQGEVLHGLSAGSNLMRLPLTSSNLASLGSLSLSGKTLDTSADGYGRGEESCAIILGTVEPDSENVIGIVLGK